MLEQAIPQLVDGVVSVSRSRPIGGGSISQASQVSVTDRDGRQATLFVKSNDASFLDNFQAEREGLVRLGETGVIGAAEPLAVGRVGDRAYLVTPWIDRGDSDVEFFVDFGRALADLHRVTEGDRIGLDRDNYLGAAIQRNAPMESWCEFVAVQRIEFQIRWAIDQGLADSRLQRDCQQIIDSIDQLLAGRDRPTSLIHGDLWSGNYWCGSDRRPVIVDPAVYYGCREAEFGMLKLFGSPPADFYDAYDDRFPLPSGWQRRTNVYVLYHLLNHLNLFGGGYHAQCCSMAANILSS